MCVTGGVDIPDNLLNKDIHYLEECPPTDNEYQKHLILLLALHFGKLKEKFFELYSFDKVNFECILKMEDDCIQRIILEVNEILEIKPLKVQNV